MTTIARTAARGGMIPAADCVGVVVAVVCVTPVAVSETAGAVVPGVVVVIVAAVVGTVVTAVIVVVVVVVSVVDAVADVVVSPVVEPSPDTVTCRVPGEGDIRSPPSALMSIPEIPTDAVPGPTPLIFTVASTTFVAPACTPLLRSMALIVYPFVTGAFWFRAAHGGKAASVTVTIEGDVTIVRL
jgi:hypothetical protein